MLDVTQSNGLNITGNSAFMGCNNLVWSATDAPVIATADLTNACFGNSKLVGAGLCNLDVSLVENFFQMYLGCTLFNEAIGVYDMGSAKNIAGMLRSCPNFNQPVGSWNVGNVTQASHVFAGSGYDQPLADWDVRKFQSMHAMLSSCPYNHPLTNWQTLALTNPSWLFNGNSQFNHPLAHLYMGLVVNLENFLNGASSFDQDLTGLNIGNVGNMSAMLNNCGMSTANYDAFLIMCKGQTVQIGVPLGAQGLTYTIAPAAGGVARGNLVSAPQLWTITGDTSVGVFQFAVKTDNTGTSNNDQFTIPLYSGETYDFTVAYDGQETTHNTDSDLTLTFPSGAGTYDVVITGAFAGIYFNNAGDKLKLTEVSSFGTSFTRLDSVFRGCSNCLGFCCAIPYHADITSLAYAWRDCNSLNELPRLIPGHRQRHDRYS